MKLSKASWKASWKTTVGGIIAFTMLILGEVQKGIDDDPLTHVNYTAIIEAAALLWMGLSARDNDVSSERAERNEGTVIDDDER